MKQQLLSVLLFLMTTFMFSQEISFTFVNARNTNDGTNDYYEADIYMASTVDFKLGSGQIYFNFNTAAFGENIKASGNFDYQQPAASILGSTYSGFPAYKDFVDNDNITSRVSISFQQGLSSGTITANNITSTPAHLFSIKIKYEDVSQDPMVAFENDNDVLDQATDQFYTACGPAAFGFPDCFNEPGTRIFNGAFNSEGASRIDEIVWDGSTDSSWTDGSNFDSGTAAVSTDDIIVPNVATTPEIITNVQVNDLTVASLSSFDISETGSLQVDGDFTNSGTFTITSTASTSGALLANGAVTGDVTYERGGLLANKWSIVSAPISGQSIKDFVENASNDIRVNTSSTPHRYAVSYYDDSKALGSKWVYFDVDYLTANPSEAFEKGRSYAISRATEGGVTFTGTLETTDVTKSVTASEWNAVGNPYTAFLPINENAGTNFINDNLVKFDPTNVGVYVWDNAQDKYVGKSLVSSEASFAPGQGFFIKTTTGVSDVIFSESERKVQPVTGGTFARGVQKLRPSIQLLAKSKEITIDTNIKYFETATEGLDPGYDLGNYGRSSFDLYTRLIGEESGKDFTIQSISTESIETTILPIGLKSASGEEVVFSVKTTDLPEGVEIFIEDKELNTFTKLNDNESYTVKTTEKLNGTGRFYLHTRQSKVPTIITDISNVKVYAVSNNNLIIDGINKGDFKLTLYAVHGASVFTKTIVGDGKNAVILPTLQTGVYIVKINSELGEKTKKIIIK